MSATKTCVGCDAVVLEEFFSRGAMVFRDETRVEWGVCEGCYHKAHRSRSSLRYFNARTGKKLVANPERYRVTA